jgi:hypothetical protein
LGYTIGHLKGSPVVAKKSHHWHFLDVPFSKNVMLFDGVHFLCQEINAFGQLSILINNKLTAPNWPASMIGPCVCFIENYKYNVNYIMFMYGGRASAICM